MITQWYHLIFFFFFSSRTGSFFFLGVEAGLGLEELAGAAAALFGCCAGAGFGALQLATTHSPGSEGAEAVFSCGGLSEMWTVEPAGASMTMPPSGVVVARGRAGAAATGFPHDVQNLAPSDSLAPQWVQNAMAVVI